MKLNIPDKAIQSLANELTIVIRSCGERTAVVCHQILTSLITGASVYVVGGGRFEETLNDCLEIGLKSNKKWTLAVDADLLPAKGAIESLVEFANEQPKQVFFVLGWQLDKLFCCRRRGGLRLYRTSALRQAKEVLGTIQEGTLRPESELIRRMRLIGWEDRCFSGVGCLHDYEQFYRDIYRKTFVHAGKNREYLFLLMPIWRKMQNDDPDYRVALKGALDGLTTTTSPNINIKSINPITIEELREMGLEEKSDMIIPMLTSEDVIHIINNAERLRDDEGAGMNLLRRKLGDFPEKSSLCAKWIDVAEAIGWPSSIIWIIGAKLKRIGNVLMSSMEKRASKLVK